jgi:hypothetical protein
MFFAEILSVTLHLQSGFGLPRGNVYAAVRSRKRCEEDERIDQMWSPLVSSSYKHDCEWRRPGSAICRQEVVVYSADADAGEEHYAPVDENDAEEALSDGLLRRSVSWRHNHRYHRTFGTSRCGRLLSPAVTATSSVPL